MAIAISLLAELARTRIADAQTLEANDRFDAGFYLCGYAVELALKARICKTIGWGGFPDHASELKIFRQFHSHDLDMLLNLSGVEQAIRDELLSEWSVITTRWKPEMRYDPLTVSKAELQDAIGAAHRLVERLL